MAYDINEYLSVRAGTYQSFVSKENGCQHIALNPKMPIMCVNLESTEKLSAVLKRRSVIFSCSTMICTSPITSN